MSTNLSSASAKVEVKSNAFTVPARTNGKVYIPPKLGNSLPYKYIQTVNAGNLPEATTPKSGTYGRGLGKKGGGRSKRRGRKTQRRRK
jgi:hypothetical protein